MTVAPRPAPDWTDRLLLAGIALPIVYFGIQLIASRFYPAYSFVTRDASTLGAAESTAPWIFNYGALLVGALLVTFAAASLRAMPRAGFGPVLTAVLAVALVSGAVGSVNAFLHPLPDPRHGVGPLALLGAGLRLLPPLLVIVVWRLGARITASGLALAFVALIAMVTGLVQRMSMWAGIDFSGYQAFLNGYHGLMQRVTSALMFVPLALIAYRLRSR